MAGSEAAAATLVERFRGQGVICEVLPFARAYHTAAFEAALGPIRAFFDDLPMEPPDDPDRLLRHRGPDARGRRGDPPPGGRAVGAARRLPVHDRGDARRGRARFRRGRGARAT